jgi:hypothetical protein
LIAENDAVGCVPATSVAADRPTVATKLEDLLVRRRSGAGQLPQLAGEAENHPGDRPGTFTQFVRAAATAGVQSIASYRPERGRIVRTSLVLMLLLQPLLVLGWSLAAAAGVAIYYLSVGGDAFWRKVISIYRWMQTRWPEMARRIKLRAFVIGRRWDRVLLELPSGLADQLRPPDLRQMMAADARHDAALAERLGRLHDDSLV